MKQYSNNFKGPAMLAMALAVHGAFAQTAPAPVAEPESGIQTVTVTATRREARMQDVPIAVTAVSGADLGNRQQHDISALARSVPNMTVSPFVGDPTNATVSLRGQVAIDNTPTIDPAVGLYVDGVYLARSSGGNLSMIDVDRVEALRGPQGTLFGRNTIGGALNVIPTRPKKDFGGSLEGSFGNYSSQDYTGIVNIPINEQVATRFVLKHAEHDGYAKSSVTGAELNASNLDYARGSVFARMGDWSLLLSGDYTRFKNDGQWVTLMWANPANPAVVGLTRFTPGGTGNILDYVNPYTTTPASTTSGPFSSSSGGVSATISGQLSENTRFKSITAVRNSKRENANNDLDGTPYWLLQQDNGTVFGLPSGDHFKQRQFSQEIQFYGDALDDKLDWIAGAYYFKEDSDLITAAKFGFIPGISNSIAITDATDIINTSASVFGQAGYKLSDTFKLTAGVRYVQDSRQLTLASRSGHVATGATIGCSIKQAVAPRCVVPVTASKFNYTPFTVGLDYQPDRKSLYYAKYSRGFRAGGFNTRASDTLALSAYNPESVDSFEVGTKLDIGRNFRFNAAVYHSLFKDIQFQAVTSATINNVLISTSTITNAGKAEVNGIELEAVAALGKLQLSASAGVIDYKYTEILPGVTGVTLDSPFTFVPKVTYGINADYDFASDFGTFKLHGDYTYKGKVYFAAVPPANPAAVGEAYGLFNSVLTFTPNANKNLELRLWVRNIADKQYSARSLDLSALGFVNNLPGDPRTYGVSLKYRF